MTVIALSLLTITVAGIGVYQLLLYQREQETDRFNSRIYRGYVRHTDLQQEKATDAAVGPPTVRKPNQKHIDREMTRKLLDHPAVTPGGGFMAPGVRPTGVVIIDAIDRAQTRQRDLSRNPAL